MKNIIFENMSGLVDSSANKDETVELIRDEVRHEKLSKRKYKRDFEIGKTRSILGNLNDDDNVYDEKYVTETARIFRKKTLPIQEYRKFQNALIQSKNHISAFFKVENAIQGLSRDLSGTSAPSKLAAANCCCNISLGDSKACFSLCKFTAPYLIAELESPSQPLVEVCAWTIGNLCVGSSKAFSVLHAQGCFKSLINLAKQCPDTLLPALSYACLRYLYAGGTSIDPVDVQEFEKIIVQRVTKICDTDSETLWLLAILPSHPNSISYIIKLVPVIYGYLCEDVCKTDQNVQKLAASLRVICNTVSEPSGFVAQVLLDEKNGNGALILDKLLGHQYNNLRKETLWLLGNLLNHNLEIVQQATKSILPSLPSMKLALNSVKQRDE